MKSTKEDKAMQGKTRSLNILPVALFFAFASVYDAGAGRRCYREGSFC